MRKLIIGITTLFVAAAFFIGCSKEIVRTETCFDGILNNSETQIDCGGPCKPCQTATVVVTPPCTPNNNTVTFNGSYSAFVSTSTVSGQFDVTANTSNGDLDIRFPSQPTADGIYTTVSTSSPAAGQCHMTYTSFNTYAPPAGSNVYVNIVGGNVVITYCNLPFSGPATVNSRAKITCP